MVCLCCCDRPNVWISITTMKTSCLDISSICMVRPVPLEILIYWFSNLSRVCCTNDFTGMFMKIIFHLNSNLRMFYSRSYILTRSRIECLFWTSYLLIGRKKLLSLGFIDARASQRLDVPFFMHSSVSFKITKKITKRHIIIRETNPG